MNPTFMDSREKVLGWSSKYRRHTFWNALNFRGSPEKRSGTGTLGSGGGITTAGAEAARSWAGAAEAEGAAERFWLTGADDTARFYRRPSS